MKTALASESGLGDWLSEIQAAWARGAENVLELAGLIWQARESLRPRSTPNNYLYSAQQRDPELGLDYNRARYLNTAIGRFWTMDQIEGNNEDPFSLHRYLYAEDEPTDRNDPIGTSSYLFFDPNGGPDFDEGAGHVGVGVDSGTNVLRRDAAWGEVGPLVVFKSEQEARFGATIVVVFPDQKLANGGMSDDAIASFLRSGESDLGIVYCSNYSAEVLRAGGHDLGYWAGITPTGLLEDAEEEPGVRVDLFDNSVMTLHTTVSSSTPPTGTIDVNTPTIFLDLSATVDSVQF